MIRKIQIKPNELGIYPDYNLFSIYTNNDGERFIHIHGYLWKNVDGMTPGWSITEGKFLIVPLDEFIENYQKVEDYMDLLWEETCQYQDDGMTKEEAEDIIMTYFNGKGPDAILPFENITNDIKDGHYLY